MGSHPHLSIVPPLPRMESQTKKLRKAHKCYEMLPHNLNVLNSPLHNRHHQYEELSKLGFHNPKCTSAIHRLKGKVPRLPRRQVLQHHPVLDENKKVSTPHYTLEHVPCQQRYLAPSKAKRTVSWEQRALGTRKRNSCPIKLRKRKLDNCPNVTMDNCPDLRMDNCPLNRN